MLSDYTVTLYNYNPVTQQSSVVVPGGSGNRLVLQLAPGNTLSADDYRVYLPNQVEPGDVDTRIFDIYSNQLDGENLGNQTSTSSPDFPSLPELRRPAVRRHQSPERHERRRRGRRRVHGRLHGRELRQRRLCTAGLRREPALAEHAVGRLAGQALPGAGARGQPGHGAGELRQPHRSRTAGSTARSSISPATSIRPLISAATASSSSRRFTQPLSSRLPRSSRPAARSWWSPRRAFRSATRSPAWSRRRASCSRRLPATTAASPTAARRCRSTRPWSFRPGATLKSQNAALFVQNQGSALQALGTPTNPVTFTSYNDASIGGATNNNPDTQPVRGRLGRDRLPQLRRDECRTARAVPGRRDPDWPRLAAPRFPALRT